MIQPGPAVLNRPGKPTSRRVRGRHGLILGRGSLQECPAGSSQAPTRRLNRHLCSLSTPDCNVHSRLQPVVVPGGKMDGFAHKQGRAAPHPAAQRVGRRYENEPD